MLHVHFGNRIEGLADALAKVLAQPADPDPLRPETVVVGHGGMGEWLKRALAARLGIAANLDLPFPASFIWSALRALDPGLPRTSPLDRGPLAWRLYRALSAGGGAGPAARYLAGGDELAPFELARELASVFEQYQIYRPAWIRDWEAGRADSGPAEWQAALWREAAAGAVPNPAQLFERFVRRADSLAGHPALPARLSVFGISALAPVYLELFGALAQTRDVHLFVPDPSQAYWGDIEPEARLARWQLTRPERAEYATSGHPLLASLGAQTRDFIELLHDVPGESIAHENFTRPSDINLLARLQGDILDLAEQPEKKQTDAADESVQLHVCHSRMREIEVLHDALLARFEADPTLGPEDILVMAPNIDDYADHVGAVFGAAPPGRYIPWSLADRSVREEHPIPEAVLELLDLPESRLRVSDVVGLLELPSVARAHGLDAQSLGDLRRWVECAGVRWGLDGTHRVALGLPDEEAFTWRFGFDRLLAGYALAPGDETGWNGIAPWGEFEGQAARPLGALCAFVERLAQWRESLAAPRPFADWAAAMLELLALFQPEAVGETTAVAVVRQAVNDLAGQAVDAEFADAVPRTVARAALAARLAVPRHPSPFLSGRVTFCALVPMRSIPARVVWLLGMGEADFPRRGRPPGFDLIAEHPRRGDRARRTEDRALFLDALCAARESFQLSYVGRSERDDAELPPSVVVSELLEMLERMGADKGNVVQQHPLQPFSARYRAEPRRGASYAQEWLGAPNPEVQPKVFAPSTPLDRDLERVVTLDELVRAFANPARTFQQVLQIATRTEETLLEDYEPFALDGLGQWKLRDALLARFMERGGGFEPQACRAEFAARGWLPLGEAGRLAYDEIAAETAQLAAAVRALVGSEAPETREIDLAPGDWRLRGSIPDVYKSAGYVFARAGKLRAKDRLALWIRHLALGIAAGAGTASHFVGMEKGAVRHVAWGAVANPAAELAKLCELYARMQREALPLLPDLSYEFCATTEKKGEDSAYAKVQANWRNERYHADGEDEYAAVMRGCDPFGAAFGNLAKAVFGPMIEAEDKS